MLCLFKLVFFVMQ